MQVDRNATVEIKISEDNRIAHFDFEGWGLANMHDASQTLIPQLSYNAAIHTTATDVCLQLAAWKSAGH